MITSQELESLLLKAFPGADIQVQSHDNVHFNAEIAAPQFKGLSRVAMQQKVYAALGDLITSNKVHALSLKTTVKE